MNAQTVFLVCLGAGVLSLVAALGRARLSWRADVPRFSRSTPVAEVWLHPERFAVSEAVPGIRMLVGAGICLLLVAAATLAAQLLGASV